MTSELVKLLHGAERQFIKTVHLKILSHVFRHSRFLSVDMQKVSGKTYSVTFPAEATTTSRSVFLYFVSCGGTLGGAAARSPKSAYSKF